MLSCGLTCHTGGLWQFFRVFCLNFLRMLNQMAVTFLITGLFLDNVSKTCELLKIIHMQGWNFKKYLLSDKFRRFSSMLPQYHDASDHWLGLSSVQLEDLCGGCLRLLLGQAGRKLECVLYDFYQNVQHWDSQSCHVFGICLHFEEWYFLMEHYDLGI